MCKIAFYIHCVEIVSSVYRTLFLHTTCGKLNLFHALLFKRARKRTSRTECENSYFRYKCKKVILTSWERLRPSEARVKRPHVDKITFSLVYRTQFFYTMFTKPDLAHALLFERAQSGHYTHGV